MRNVLILLSLLAGAHASALAQTTAPAPALTAAELQSRSLAAVCAQCHGTAGKAVPGSLLPSLAGMPAGYLADQMRAFKEGRRQAQVMHQIAKGYSEAQIVQLASYFAAQNAARTP